ncbi:hypothetical protein Pcinc_037659 [Petrolisthes cinctipes]|uniref:Uncharacterized protein n=1 Tax=Petrolisthes cinctipes TaxID=88211 RepID=A0AAE1BW26_PETCI|nr:hypothetical protein Pcinc_037659 [Petrolisthes cinctipes]
MSQSPSWQMPATCVALVWNALSQVWTRVPPGVWDELCPLFGGVMSGMRRWGVSQQEGQPAEYPSSLQASATLSMDRLEADAEEELLSPPPHTLPVSSK